MQVEVNMNPEDIQQQVVSAIMASAIGIEISKAINKLLNDAVGTNYQRQNLVEIAVRSVLETQVQRMASEIIESRKEEIRQQIASQLTDGVISKMVNTLWSVMAGRLVSKDY